MSRERTATNENDTLAKLVNERPKALKVAGPKAAIDAATKIRVLVADNDVISRYGLHKLLEAQPDFVIVGEATDAAEAVRLTNELKPDVLLFALPMPGVPSLDILREVIGDCATMRTILLTAAIDTPDTIKVLRLGARGIVLKNSPT